MSDQQRAFEILNEATDIAILGCSGTESRTSHRVASYLQEQGYTIYPINPNHEEILGRTCYDSLSDLPEDVTIDIVDIFRRPEEAEAMVEQIIAWGEERDQKPVIWTQIGVSTEDARKKAQDAGFEYIRNRCTMADHHSM